MNYRAYLLEKCYNKRNKKCLKVGYMAKRRYRRKGQRLSIWEEIDWTVNPDTVRDVAAVVLIIVGLITFLGPFNLSGSFGRFLPTVSLPRCLHQREKLPSWTGQRNPAPVASPCMSTSSPPLPRNSRQARRRSKNFPRSLAAATACHRRSSRPQW